MTSSTSAAPLAHLEGVHVELGGRDVLCHVDARVERASLTAIAGPNGAGKSTLLEVIAGTRAPSSGAVRLTTDAVGFVPQRAAVSELLPVTVRDVVTVGAWGRLGAWRRLDAVARDAVDDVLDRLALTDLQRRPFAELSGGQRQRALLAQGLARRADLLLLDEPTTALDADSGRRIRDAVASEIRRGAAVVCVTHDEGIIAGADHVIRLEAGRVVDAVRPAGGPSRSHSS
ncbi:ATP-binding cassette domain-containing protein [Microbacterium sp. CFH 90308]|uniref:ATP-binding cassette domain-containing protein n=1 Tax=Microbacterium salsuginis TaxID=2722803 RepID=A0ABX1K7P1_9MICO|nr:zinc ABC transporter ATP-binding protein AztA [Microbacterium sp. CFH 90308]NLP83007.1 ATP-binding cassette domain-containing protein [Microbacterium sp. CFH 90308]